MERINPDMNLHHSGTSETSKTPSPTLQEYKVTVGKLILKSRLAYSLPALEVQELAAATEAWCEVLIDTIPIQRVADCYLHAMKNRDSSFPLSAGDLVRSWKDICNANRYKPVSAGLDHQLRGDVCQDCNGTGTELITEGSMTYSRRCRHLS